MNYAIIIGIDHYKERPLTGAVADAVSFSEWLKQSGMIIYDETKKKDEQVYLKLLTSESGNEVALGHEIDFAIVDIIEDARKHENEKNRLYFFFSGHGIGKTYSNTALCLRYWYSKFPNFCISSRDYVDGLVNQGVFDEILIFLDCCRENDYLADPIRPLFDAQTMVGAKKAPSILTCYSTIFGKLSYEINQMDPNQKRGAFTSFLIEALKGDADADQDGVITGSDLKKHIREHFPTYALKYNKIQEATSEDGNNGEAIVICSNAVQPVSYNFVLTFTRNSTVSLFGPNAELIKTGVITPATKWTEHLAKGFHRLVDDQTREEKYFTNFNINTVNNESF